MVYSIKTMSSFDQKIRTNDFKNQKSDGAEFWEETVVFSILVLREIAIDFGVNKSSLR